MAVSNRTKAILTWVLRGLLAILFVLVGLPKLNAIQAWVTQFTRWGYPLWFMYTVGVAEIIGAIGLLLPRTVRYAAVFLATIMVGAAFTHAIAGEWERVPWNGAYIVALWGVWRLTRQAPATDESSQ